MSKPQRPQAIKRPVAIAVEGDDYFYSLLPVLDGPPEFDVVQLWDFSAQESGSSAERWLTLFKSLRGFDGVRAIGLIRDAEDNAVERHTEMQRALRNNALGVPPRPRDVLAGHPATGFLIMPHGAAAGCIENSFLDAAVADAPMNCAQDFLRCVDREERNDNWRAKVLVHALITASDKPSSTLGQSVMQGKLWHLSHPSLSVMVEFIRDLIHAGEQPPSGAAEAPLQQE